TEDGGAELDGGPLGRDPPESPGDPAGGDKASGRDLEEPASRGSHGVLSSHRSGVRHARRASAGPFHPGSYEARRRTVNRHSANGGAGLTPPTPHASVDFAMAETLVGRLRRAEATVRQDFAGPEAEWPERRRRARLDVLREHIATAYERLRTRHADGASGAE